MRTPLPSLQMCGELGAPAASALVPRAAVEQMVLPKISTHQLLPFFATGLITADSYLFWEGR